MKKTDVLVLFTDMQRFDTIAALGNPVIKTPNLDRLAREGTAFTSCYSPSPVCIPARWSMHYGKYPTKSKLFDNGPMPPHEKGSSLPERMIAAGYRAGDVGKCHFTPDAAALRGFESRVIQEEGCSDPAKDDYCKYLQDRNLSTEEPLGARGEMYYIPQLSRYSEEDHASAFIRKNTVEYLRERREKGENYFLFSSFIHPHPPLAIPHLWSKLYRSFDMPSPKMPQDCRSLYTWVNYYQNRYKYQDRGFNENLRELQKAYYYMAISFVDYQIGMILDELEKNGKLDDTLIVFASDHGEHLGDYGCYGKRSMLDVSSRVPLLVRGPGFEAGRRAEFPVSLIDIFPTCCEAAGADASGIDGISLQRQLAGEKRKYVFSQYSSAGSGIYMFVSEEWKYVYSAGDRREWLFDRKRDPEETYDAGPNRPAELAEHKKALLEFLKQEGETDAFVETPEGKLDWREYPRYDLSFLASPRAGLLTQDHQLKHLDVKGYTR